MTTDAPLDLRELFSRPLAGTATIWRPWWLRSLPIASNFRFHTEISEVALAETTGLLVRDTTTFPNGKVWQRTMRAQLLAPGHWIISADDMPGGAEQWTTADGFQFAYTIVAPVLGPIRLPLRCVDEVRLVDESTMTDTVVMRFLGVHVATVTMPLKRT